MISSGDHMIYFTPGCLPHERIFSTAASYTDPCVKCVILVNGFNLFKTKETKKYLSILHTVCCFDVEFAKVNLANC